MLKIHNSLSRKKEQFTPIEPGKVRMYVCGMTVYDYCHLGHARVMVVFDMVARWLRASSYDVTYVRNITDIDDKIIKRAGENGESIRALTDRFIAAMHEDADALGVLRPDHEPRATEFVESMQKLIGNLVDNGLAYKAANEDMCYAVRKFDGYGKLSGKSVDELRAGERVEVAGGKHDPLDFVLWKHARPEEPGEVKWASPWGLGRPGWHIECSAMSCAVLGEHFDIHGGGMDLQFPHHENEIAQSEGASGKPFVNVWLHNGFLNIDDEKMSKSLGNFFTIRDVLQRYDGETLRFFMLRTHYRSPFNFSDSHLDDARNALRRLYTALDGFDPPDAPVDWTQPHAAAFRAAMNDDFNTPLALASLFELASQLNRARSPQAAVLLKGLGRTLGVLQQLPRDYLQGGVGLDTSCIDALIAERVAAKKSRDFATADRIRAQLAEHGVLLQDSASGTTWVRA